jgi:hypothetical protein
VRLAGAALLAVALGLIGLSADLLYRDLGLYRLHAVAKAIRFDKPVTDQDLARAVSQAIAWDRAAALNPSDADDAALAASLFAERNRTSFLAPALYQTAENLLKERLTQAPADGNSWLRLAYIHTAHAGLDGLSRAALRMSIETTPREISVMWPGLKFRVDHWAQMTVPEQFAAADLVTGLWHKPPERAALKNYLDKLPPHLLSSLLSDMIDPDARSAVLKG